MIVAARTEGVSCDLMSVTFRGSYTGLKVVVGCQLILNDSSNGHSQQLSAWSWPWLCPNSEVTHHAIHNPPYSYPFSTAIQMYSDYCYCGLIIPQGSRKRKKGCEFEPIPYLGTWMQHSTGELEWNVVIAVIHVKTIRFNIDYWSKFVTLIYCFEQPDILASVCIIEMV